MQTLNMCAAFSSWAQVKIIPGVAEEAQRDIWGYLTRNHSLQFTDAIQFNSIATTHKGLYGILYRLKLLKEWIDTKPSVFWAREPSDAMLLCKIKRFLPRNHLVLFEMHDSDYRAQKAQNQINIDHLRKKERRILHGVDGIVYTGKYLQKQMNALYASPVPSIVAPHGVNEQLFAPIDKEPHSGMNLSYFGTLSPNKGVDMLVGAMQYLPQDVRLRVIGGKPQNELEKLKALASSLKVDDRIEFTGGVQQGEIRQLLADCDLTLLPFQYEEDSLSPLKLYEAASMCLPSLISPMPAVVEAAKVLPGVAVAQGSSSKDLAQSIKALYDAPENIEAMRQAMLSNSRFYSWNARAKRIMQFATSLVPDSQ